MVVLNVAGFVWAFPGYDTTMRVKTFLVSTENKIDDEQNRKDRALHVPYSEHLLCHDSLRIT